MPRGVEGSHGLSPVRAIGVIGPPLEQVLTLVRARIGWHGAGVARTSYVFVWLEIIEGVDHVGIARYEDGLVECVEVVVRSRADQAGGARVD